MTTKTHTQRVYLCARVFDGESEPTLMIHTTDMCSLPEYSLIATKEITMEVPAEVDVNKEVIADLEEVRNQMRAAASAAIAEVDNKIASLLALEHIDA